MDDRALGKRPLHEIARIIWRWAVDWTKWDEAVLFIEGAGLERLCIQKRMVATSVSSGLFS